MTNYIFHAQPKASFITIFKSKTPLNIFQNVNPKSCSFRESSINRTRQQFQKRKTPAENSRKPRSTIALVPSPPPNLQQKRAHGKKGVCALSLSFPWTAKFTPQFSGKRERKHRRTRGPRVALEDLAHNYGEKLCEKEGETEKGESGPLRKSPRRSPRPSWLFSARALNAVRFFKCRALAR